MLTGTIINSLAILAGSAVGLVLRAVTRRSSKEVSADGLGGRLQTIIMQGMALCVLYIGVSGCLKGQNTLTAILSIALGAIIGELLDLDRRMRSLGDWVQTRTARLIHTEDGAPSISDGFVTASLLFCVGAMAIVGALENGLTGSYNTLKAKSIIDGISSIVFASSLGIGVAFSNDDPRGLADELTKTLAEMRQDGTMLAITSKYLANPESYLEVEPLER